MEEVIANNRTNGRGALEQNIFAVRTLGGIVKTTLGPRGMDKMLIDGSGRITVTNDGVTILNEMQITHPAGRLLGEIAKTQEKEIGDGTTSVIIYASELLKNAERLIDKGIHPTTIIKGYALAEKKAKEILEENAVMVEDDETLIKIAKTAMTGKGAEGYRQQLSEIIVEASKVGKENISFQGIIGRPIDQTSLVKGVVIDKEIPENMPKEGKNLRIGLLDIDLDARQTEVDTNIQFNTFDDMSKFQENEDESFKKYAEKIIAAGVGAVFCTKSINDKVLYHLSKKGIIGIRRVNKFDMDMLVKTTGATLVSSLEDFTEGKFGGGSIRQEREDDDNCKLFVEHDDLPIAPCNAVTILVTATTEHLLQEIKRAMTDGLGDVLVSKNSKVVAGGGAIEIEVCKKLKEYANSLPGTSQLAVNEFADAIESIPEILTQNAGLNSINILAELRSEHELRKDTEGKYIGINLFTDKIENTLEAGIIEPLKIKTLAISSAVEFTTQILRTDDILGAAPQNG